MISFLSSSNSGAGILVSVLVESSVKISRSSKLLSPKSAPYTFFANLYGLAVEATTVIISSSSLGLQKGEPDIVHNTL